MNHADDIESAIKELHLTTSAQTDKHILDDAFAALKESTRRESVGIEPSIRRMALSSRMIRLAAAAAAIIIIVSLFFTLSTPKTLYAQIAEALADVRTLHMIVTYQDDQQRVDSEIWYDREIGLSKFDYHDGKKFVRIYDGSHIWQYSPANNFAVRTSHINPDYFITELLNISPSQDFVREPAGDKLIDGFQCQLYVSSNDDDTRQTRMWLDEANRVRHTDALYLRQDGSWQRSYVAEFKYDIPVERYVFSTDFGPNVKIIDAENLLEEQFSAENAIWAEVSLGLTFAVHEAQQCQDGSVYVVSSIRPTDSSRQVVNQRDRRAYNFGHFSLNPGRYISQSSRPLNPIELARSYHNGIEVKWHLLVNANQETFKADKCQLWAIMFNCGKLQRHRKDEGLELYKSLRPTVALTKTNRAIKEIIEEVYSQAQILEPILATVCLDLSREIVPDPTGQSRTGKVYRQRTIAPSQISLDEYNYAIMTEIDRLKNRLRGPEYTGTPEP